MFKIIKRIVLLIIGIIIFLVIKSHVSFEERTPSTNTEKNQAKPSLEELLRVKADSARTFCVSKKYNTDYCILIDFSIHSGKKRFFVWDFKGDSIKLSSLCAHGYGQNSTTKKPVFSNVEGSYCSSLGKYKIGIRSYSKWGINVHYKMHGLEKTNDNAYKRYVVLHSYEHVPERETYPIHLPLGMSQGCPVISNNTMRSIDELLKTVEKPILMWIYI
ncbi:murein L,D-transpeptidase catalytic domain-containing protein [Bacteroides sp. 519]|uniref:murein L,D-transpeptidase catalytic domain-containing protein n=1 Tax=Bacteroides sp. 519 TaxID=2302937 RepID=UPI0013CF6F8D|nr:murein L,D-transpeptidase catalytic domain family protein [Bacteroides sp. 519]NDV58858.1 peptidase [Bacteroides sp. 519]